MMTGVITSRPAATCGVGPSTPGLTPGVRLAQGAPMPDPLIAVFARHLRLPRDEAAELVEHMRDDDRTAARSLLRHVECPTIGLIALAFRAESEHVREHPWDHAAVEKLLQHRAHYGGIIDELPVPGAYTRRQPEQKPARVYPQPAEDDPYELPPG